jgi:hypothetical protein
VDVVFLDDAQDELMDGIFRIKSTQLVLFYNKLLVAVWKRHNNSKKMKIMEVLIYLVLVLVH